MFGLPHSRTITFSPHDRKTEPLPLADTSSYAIFFMKAITYISIFMSLITSSQGECDDVVEIERLHIYVKDNTLLSAAHHYLSDAPRLAALSKASLLVTLHRSREYARISWNGHDCSPELNYDWPCTPIFAYDNLSRQYMHFRRRQYITAQALEKYIYYREQGNGDESIATD